MNTEKSTIAKATDIMLEAMEGLISGKVTPETATAVALNGRTIVEAAREASNFAKVTGYLPVDSVYGKALQPLEPQVTKEAMAAQKVRLSDSRTVDVIPPKLSASDPYKVNKGEGV